MKKTLTINISGTVFHIDEDAYEKLKSYLQKINAHFSGQEGGHEIVTDIEARIAELFTQKMNSEQTVVNETMVNEVIELMGLPEDFDPEQTESDPGKSHSSNYYSKNKRLYRDPDSRVLGGVCSGLGHYLGLDKVLVRVLFFIFIIATSGVGFFAYLIFWIAVPKARTTSQRLEMRGEDINVENIGRSVKEEFNEMKESYSKYKNSDEFQKSKAYAQNVGRGAQKAGKETVNILAKIFGAFFIFVGFLSLVGLVLGLLGFSRIIGFMPEFMAGAEPGIFLDHIFSGGMATTLLISTFVIAGVPLLLIIYAGTKMLFNYVSSSKSIVLSALGIWVIGIILAVATALGAVDVFSTSASISEEETIYSEADTLYISIDETKFEDFEETSFEINSVKILVKDEKEVLVARPQFTIVPTSGDEMEMKFRKISRGNNYRDAKNNLFDIEYSYALDGNELKFDPYFRLEEDKKWRSQKLELVLKLPKGKTVYLNDNLLPIIYDIENTTNTWDGDMVGEYWKMLPEGLTISN